MTNLPTPDSYPWLPQGPGTAKLAESAIDPIVAAARGYQYVPKGQTDQWAKANGIDRRSTQYRDLFRWSAAADTGFLMLPWHHGGDPDRTMNQWRPDLPFDPDGNGYRKYLIHTGERSPIDQHPAFRTRFARQLDTPTHRNAKPSDISYELIQDYYRHFQPTRDPEPVNRVYITEGLLKGDAIISAWIRENIPDDAYQFALNHVTIQQAKSPEKGRTTALQRLSAFLLRCPIRVATFIGVGNWHRNPDWDSIDTRAAHAVVAFDADIATNPNVWRQAAQVAERLQSQGAEEVSFLNLPRSQDTHLGIDDYLAQGHPLSSIDNHLGPLPPKPGTDQYERAQRLSWRVKPGDPADPETGHTCEIKLEQNIPGGGKETRWTHIADIAGRIRAVTTVRVPTEDEMRTGIFNPEAEGDKTLDIEVAWYRQGETGTNPLHVPFRAWGKPRADWPDRYGIHIPDAVFTHPDWPLLDDRRWASAVAAHRADETARITRFSRMGWVPVDETGHAMRFLIGEQSIDADGVHDAPEGAALLLSGDGKSIMPVAAKYGVRQPAWDADWKTTARTVLEKTVDAYAAPGTSPWTDQALGLFALACMFRPIMPETPHLVPYLYGGPATGKSWTSAMIMAGWQRHGGTWTNESLPGSAKDTLAATEILISGLPIFVRDDQAPSPDRSTQKRQQTEMEMLVRAVHDSAPRQRATANMALQESKRPHAMFILNGENEPETGSVLSRVILIGFSRGTLADGATRSEAARMAADGETAKATAALARLAADRIRETGWAAWREEYLGLRDGWSAGDTPAARALADDFGGDSWRGLKAIVEDMIRADKPSIDQGNLDRISRSAADLGATLIMAARLSGANEGLLAGLSGPGALHELVRLLVANRSDDMLKSPGKGLLEGVRHALATHQGYLGRDDGDEHAPPAGASPTDMGWVPRGDSDWAVPTGKGVARIGYVTPASPGVPAIAWLLPRPAHTAAKKAAPEMVQGETKTSWTGFWDEGFAATDTGLTRTGYTVNKRLPRVSTSAIRMVPVPLSLLLGQLDYDRDEQDFFA